MNNIDRQIDIALQTLGSAAPRNGINQRLLARLENRTTAPATSWRPMLTFAPPAAALLTVALLLLAFHPTQHPTGTTTAQITEYPTTSTTLATPTARQPFVASSAHPILASVAPSAVNHAAETDPAYLPSFPAPTAPLTADERRLVLIAQHAHSYDVARLEAPPQPLARQRQEAISDYIHHMLAPLVTAESFSPTQPVENGPPPPTQPEVQPEQQSDSSSSPQ